MGVRLYRSNRLECLVDKLAELLESTPHPPWRQRTIVVPGSGFDHWLSLELAKRFGIWANARFPFPRNFFEGLFAAAGLPPLEGQNVYEPQNLVWAIAKELLPLLDRPEFEPVRLYLDTVHDPASASGERSATGAAYVSLCARLAEVFDHYGVYRPQWLHLWEAGHYDSNDWQAVLWRAIVSRFGPQHFSARAKRWVELLREGRVSYLPPHCILFGITHLPPVYVQLLAELSQRTEVHLFLPSPSPEYWAEIRSRRQLWRERLARWATLPDLEESVEQYEGNPLLASLGRVGREFQAIVESSLEYEDVGAYERPEGSSMLAVLQRDMFDLVSRPSASAPPLPLPEGDRSIRIHSCHSPLRELEVLRDQLRALLEADPTLKPEDILVLCPDVRAYAPVIDAVFGSDRDDPSHIPYSIADAAESSSPGASEAFLLALDLLRGRISAGEVFRLLSADAVRAQFGITDADVELARQWFGQVGVRWGIDGSHRRAFGYPEFSEHSWRFALQRLLLGAAMPPDPARLFRGVSPFPEVEGEGAEFAGKLAELCERLFAWHPLLQRTRPVAEWSTIFDRIRRELLSDRDAYAHEHRELASGIAELRAGAELAGFDAPVPVDPLLPWLSAWLQREGGTFGFLRGGVNFCALRTTRCVPARVVCLVGMNDGAFPRGAVAFPMNKATHQREVGDPDAREEDRFLFLQALLAARDAFVVTYAGRDIRNNSERPPAVVVAELLDTIDRTFVAPPGPGRASQAVLVQHPLQPFSARYFRGDPDLVSFSAALCDGARRSLGKRRAPQRLVRDLLNPPSERVVTVDQLVSWVEHPPVGFLRQRLGLALGFDVAALDDDLPVDLEGLDLWKIGNTILELCAQGIEMNDTYEVLRAMGQLPPGRLGREEWQRACEDARPLWGHIEPYVRGERRSPIDLDLQVNGWTITGALRGVWKEGQVVWTFSRLSAKHIVQAWVRHLVLCTLAMRSQQRVPTKTLLIGRSEKKQARRGERETVRVLEYAEEGAAQSLLGSLVNLYELGLRYPLPFAVEAGWEFLHHPDDRAKQIQAARAKLQGGWQQQLPERQQFAYWLLYRSTQPSIDDLEGERPAAVPSFAELSEAILEPLLAPGKIVER